MTNVKQIISDLEEQRAAIDQAITALRGIADSSGSGITRSRPTSAPAVKRGVTAEGRQRLAEAMRRRWAAKRAAKSAPASKVASAGTRMKKQSRAKKVGRKRSAAKTAAAGRA